MGDVVSIGERILFDKIIHEVRQLNRMLDEELPDCPKLEITENSIVGDTPGLIARFNAEFRSYLLQRDKNNAN